MLSGCNFRIGNGSDISSAKLAEKFNKSEIKNKYILEGNQLKRTVKDDWKDTIRVAIGNKTELGAETNFEPRLEISRWDEVSFSIIPKAIKDVPIKDQQLSFDGNKIKYINGSKTEIDFYELPISKENPEGAYEVEWILKEKPATNKIEFTLETKGLDFFYQPPLNEEMASTTCSETDCGGSHRPENVVGSYAVYASENKINYVGGKEYKTGQVGMIYRPRICDSDNLCVWEEMKIEDGILIITIPQDFLDKAIYPISSKGVNFGYDTLGGSDSGTFYITGNYYTNAPSTATLDSFSMGYRVYATGIKFRGAIYNQDLSLLTNSVTPEVTGTNNNTRQFYTINYVDKPTLTATNNYYLVDQVGGTDGHICHAYNTISAETAIYYNNGTNYPTFPNPITTAASRTEKVSIYATYTAGGGGTTYCGHTGGDWFVNSECFISASTSTPGTLYIGNGGSINCIDGATIEVGQIQATKGQRAFMDRGCKLTKRTY